MWFLSFALIRMVNLEYDLILFFSKLIIVIDVLIWSDNDTCVVTSCEDTGTQTNKQDEVHTLLPSVDVKVMRKLVHDKPSSTDLTSHHSFGILSELGGLCAWFMHKVTVSHNAASTCFYVWSEDEFLSAGLSRLAGGVRLSWSWCWQASGRWPTSLALCHNWGASTAREELLFLPEGLRDLNDALWGFFLFFLAKFSFQLESVSNLRDEQTTAAAVCLMWHFPGGLDCGPFLSGET